MRTIVLFVLALGVHSFANAEDHEVTLDSYLYSVSQLKEVRPATVDQGYFLLERIVKAGGKVDRVNMEKIMKVHLFLLQNDKTNWGPELLAPLFNANKQLYQDVLKTFKPAEIELIKRRQKVFERESKEGNG
ncbi:MAG: hypothetical protein KDD37_11500 [Bdellovibrionales bacterium]|nr:hypothetical protein [Bdellovibrionales bacterium]